MHVPSQEDPPPDAPVYVSHVVCEHGGLVLNTALRRRISAEVCQFPLVIHMAANEGPYYRQAIFCSAFSLLGDQHRMYSSLAQFVRRYYICRRRVNTDCA